MERFPPFIKSHSSSSKIFGLIECPFQSFPNASFYTNFGFFGICLFTLGIVNAEKIRIGGILVYL